ncbi:MAG: hypothetical protein QGG14_09505 [Planctomycetota bacterium]|jgi:hypothetical protein|nr:hypothetical protein [Planctomycetota bacterium]
MRSIALLLVASSTLILLGQDKTKPPVLPPYQPPVQQGTQDKETKKGDQEPLPRPVSTNPFKGVWAITRLVRPHAPPQRSSGYMVFTDAFTSMHLYLPALSPQLPPRFQSSFRSYRVTGTNLVTSSLQGVRNAANRREMLIEPSGRVERRRFAFLSQQLLRIYQTDQAFMELKKIEQL